MENGIEIQIIAEPREITMDELDRFQVGVEATNRGNRAVDPKLYDIVLLVDGVHNYGWDLAIQNSPREDAWWKLGPGESISASWPLGEAMFSRPGEYEIVLRLGDQESAARIHIRPKTISKTAGASG